MYTSPNKLKEGKKLELTKPFETTVATKAEIPYPGIIMSKLIYKLYGFYIYVNRFQCT